MGILKTVLSVGAGLLAMAACYISMSRESDKSENSSVNQSQENGMGDVDPMKIRKNDDILLKLDKLQIGLINLSRFISEVVRAISLFIRATKYYGYEPG